MSKISDTHPISASGFLATLSEIIRLDSNEIFRFLKSIFQEAYRVKTVLLLKMITFPCHVLELSPFPGTVDYNIHDDEDV